MCNREETMSELANCFPLCQCSRVSTRLVHTSLLTRNHPSIPHTHTCCNLAGMTGAIDGTTTGSTTAQLMCACIRPQSHTFKHSAVWDTYVRITHVQTQFFQGPLLGACHVLPHSCDVRLRSEQTTQPDLSWLHTQNKPCIYTYSTWRYWCPQVPCQTH